MHANFFVRYGPDRGKQISIEKESHGFVKLMYVHWSLILTHPNVKYAYKQTWETAFLLQ